MYLSFLFECQCVVTRQQLIKVDCDKSHQNMQLLTRHVKCRFSDDPKIIQEINKINIGDFFYCTSEHILTRPKHNSKTNV